MCSNLLLDVNITTIVIKPKIPLVIHHVHLQQYYITTAVKQTNDAAAICMSTVDATTHVLQKGYKCHVNQIVLPINSSSPVLIIVPSWKQTIAMTRPDEQNLQ